MKPTTLFQGSLVNIDVWSTGLHNVRIYTHNGIS
jgi:hypothetical protein